MNITSKEKKSFIEGRIADLENKISAEIIITKKLKSNSYFWRNGNTRELGKKTNSIKLLELKRQMLKVVKYQFLLHLQELYSEKKLTY